MLRPVACGAQRNREDQGTGSAVDLRMEKPNLLVGARRGDEVPIVGDFELVNHIVACDSIARGGGEVCVICEDGNGSHYYMGGG